VGSKAEVYAISFNRFCIAHPLFHAPTRMSSFRQGTRERCWWAPRATRRRSQARVRHSRTSANTSTSVSTNTTTAIRRTKRLTQSNCSVEDVNDDPAGSAMPSRRCLWFLVSPFIRVFLYLLVQLACQFLVVASQRPHESRLQLREQRDPSCSRSIDAVSLMKRDGDNYISHES